MKQTQRFLVKEIDSLKKNNKALFDRAAQQVEYMYSYSYLDFHSLYQKKDVATLVSILEILSKFGLVSMQYKQQKKQLSKYINQFYCLSAYQPDC